MKALTVQQPWAWAIVHGGKDVENRTQVWSYRGPLAIHAGKRLSQRGVESRLMVRAVGDAMRRDAAAHFEYGAIIGVVDLVDVHSSVTCIDAEGAMCSPWAEFQYDEHRAVGRDRRRRDIVHLELGNPRPLQEPIPCKGRLGLWTPTADVVDAIELDLAGSQDGGWPPRASSNVSGASGSLEGVAGSPGSLGSVSWGPGAVGSGVAPDSVMPSGIHEAGTQP